MKPIVASTQQEADSRAPALIAAAAMAAAAAFSPLNALAISGGGGKNPWSHHHGASAL